MAHYRVPVFRELAQRPGLDMIVHYGFCPNLPNAEPDGFRAEPVASRQTVIANREIVWNASPWRRAGGGSNVLLLTWNLNHLNLVPTLLRAKANGIATVLWGHGYSKSEAGWRRAARERAARLADALLFYSQDIRDRFETAGFAAERLHVAPNTLDQAAIARIRAAWIKAPERLAAFRSKQKLVGPLILFVSRLKPENRLDQLLEATAMLRVQWPNLTLVVIGGGDPELHRLQARARNLEVAGSVRFLGSLYDEEALAPWFLTADAFCYPANAGLSILHAFGFGLPVVTTDNRSLQNPEIEALRPDANGLLYRDGDPAAMAEALRRLIDDPSLRARLSAGALETASRRSLGSMVDGMEGAIRFAFQAAPRSHLGPSVSHLRKHPVPVKPSAR